MVFLIGSDSVVIRNGVVQLGDLTIDPIVFSQLCTNGSVLLGDLIPYFPLCLLAF